MKFGKQILSQQISGWGSYYLDYKSLKKIINSLEKGRLTDAALFASGIRPEHIANSPESIRTSNGGAVNIPGAFSGAGTNAQILPRSEASDELQAHKAAFFFKLERELEKINEFYLQKEAELKVRLHSLVDKKNIILARRGASNLSKDSPSYFALHEGFRYFEKDLSKLQQFIEVNATGFRKILKKWDKRSKSQTKELYLARQVEVQPCFNREFIAELSDVAAANLLDLENLSETKVTRNGSLDATAASADRLLTDKRLDFTAAQNEEIDILSDLERNLSVSIKAGNTDGAKEMARIASQNEDGTSVARVIWRALLDADSEAVQRAIRSGLPDYGFIDDINLRTCLHESCLAGNLPLVKACVTNHVDIGKRDVYGRTALSYAAMTGRSDICTFLLSFPDANPTTADLDGFSPLVLAVMNGHADVVDILLSHNVSVEPTDQSDLIPLCLASEGGHAAITSMLLSRGAKILPNTEGLTPQALAARVGHADCLELLVKAGADANVREKGTLWTPIFFAAENGHLDCIRILVSAGAEVDVQDEKLRNPAFYAAWRGQVDCLLFILEASRAAKAKASNAAGKGAGQPGEDPSLPHAKRSKSDNRDADAMLEDLDGEIDGIPSLSLPPPIIPFRTYGHNYLDKRTLITVSLTNSSVKLYKLQDPNRPEQFATSSLKLVMTSRPDATLSAIPHTIILPLADEREVSSFQIESLENFSIEWELMPTFGSKVIGKAVALPSLFESITDRKKYVLPLQDVYLKVVGEVSFEIDCVKPFDGVQLEIGGRIETYWKSTLPGVPAALADGGGHQQRMTPTNGVGSQDDSDRTLHASAVSSTVSNHANSVPSNTASANAVAPTAASSSAAMSAGTFVTASSLSGQHLRVAVQVTKDGVAVAYPDLTLPLAGLDLYVGGVTGEQFSSMAQRLQREIKLDPAEALKLSLADWKSLIGRSMVTLEALLAILPLSIGIDLDVLYPSTADVRGNPSLPKSEVNAFVDAILHAVYRSGTTSSSAHSSRKILFSSRSPTVCTALNWKQPNYAVLFASYCGLAHDTGSAATNAAGADGIVRFASCDRGEPDARRSSVSEAVRFAKSNNLLGIMVDAVLLNHVPQLVHAIRSAGLLLITIGQYAPFVKVPKTLASSAAAEQSGADIELPDGSVEDGIVSAR